MYCGGPATQGGLRYGRGRGEGGGIVVLVTEHNSGRLRKLQESLAIAASGRLWLSRAASLWLSPAVAGCFWGPWCFLALSLSVATCFLDVFWRFSKRFLAPFGCQTACLWLSLAVFGSLRLSAAVCVFLWLLLAVCGSLWLSVAVCGCLWLFVAVCGCLWLSVAVCGCLWLSVPVCGCLWLSVPGCACLWLSGAIWGCL